MINMNQSVHERPPCSGVQEFLNCSRRNNFEQAFNNPAESCLPNCFLVHGCPWWFHLHERDTVLHLFVWGVLTQASQREMCVRELVQFEPGATGATAQNSQNSQNSQGQSLFATNYLYRCYFHDVFCQTPLGYQKSCPATARFPAPKRHHPTSAHNLRKELFELRPFLECWAPAGLMKKLEAMPLHCMEAKLLYMIWPRHDQRSKQQ